ncbi:MAG: putative permease (major facilitator superfamily) [Anaerolineae bacterium]|nr:MAG: putative permease (major facilitator superfamily) [Anaerolineae bacterium]
MTSSKAASFPPQFWLLFSGMLISAIGASMIWPFLMIYISERLDSPLTVNASLISLNSAAGLLSSLIAGPIIDRLGRKRVMVISLLTNALGFVFLSHATSLVAFAMLMVLQGASNPLYRVGADAMIADLIPEGKRIDAYSRMRLSNNLGVAIGPAIGGFLASVSYTLAFYGAAGGLFLYGLFVALGAKETLPALVEASRQTRLPEDKALGGYQAVLQDRRFIRFTLTLVLPQISAAILWVLLGVYTKTHFGISEKLYGWIPVTNASMVVLFQLAVTAITRRYPPLLALAIGSLLYGCGVGSVAVGSGFWWFWLSMVIVTVGEMILVPTSSTYVANLAPPDRRGRYMSLYSLTWIVASGIGPLAGGLLNDSLGPLAIWIGGGAVGVLAAVLFVWEWRAGFAAT